ncbi:methyl-accepting chemotaxis protein [Vibrio sp. SCSIO 43137]|uniref:methyl-accepting chemotaxis protein n=1 Tax=Vibrio sp. SCSIO 43137 TaxID=3021011 RepID=UPI002307CEC4|nr:methyl-accepting chemotaxis protein [Vibrio sp. SCSIO 43137]WCE32032.1 methyl-accepting chemotaxis protein [Vibrio sp. SCSIO 43137]
MLKKLGFKKLLLLSTVALVALSVSLSNLITYTDVEKVLVDQIARYNTEYAASQARLVENQLNEKVQGLEKLGQEYENRAFEGSAEDHIALTKVIAKAMNLNSAVVGFTNGDAYWNQTADTWPNHKYYDDVTKRSWYQAGRNSTTASITEPYQGSEAGNQYWVSIVRRTHSGMMSADLQLGFLGQIVKSVNTTSGAVALIVNSDSTILASSDTEQFELSGLGLDDNRIKHFIADALKAASFSSEMEIDNHEMMSFSHQIRIADKSWYYILLQDKQSAYTSLTDAKQSAIIRVVVATLVSIVLAFVVLQLLYKPILTLRETIMRLGEGHGDLTQRLDIRSGDDLGKIATGVNKLIENLNTMMVQIRDVTQLLNSNIGKLSEQSEINTNIIQGHVQETEQAVTAIEEMNSTAESMASDASNTARLTSEANAASLSSREIVNGAKESIEDLLTDVESASQNVHRMSDKTDSINAILSVISEIAEQTNLLALNAAIEAARAGEQGRGFAVVADEVRNLASRTKSSTKEIESALAALSEGSLEVVESMNQTEQRCNTTASDATNVADSLDTMTKYVSDIDELSVQIATAAEEQSCVTRELSQSMGTINTIVVQLEENVQDGFKEVQQIKKLNDQLSDMVSKFKLS